MSNPRDCRPPACSRRRRTGSLFMRGDDHQQFDVFSYVSLEERVPQEHPLRATRKLVDEIFRAMGNELDGPYAKTGRPSIPPERLLRTLLLQIFYSVRSE